jgi:hypothetical protein
MLLLAGIILSHYRAKMSERGQQERCFDKMHRQYDGLVDAPSCANVEVPLVYCNAQNVFEADVPAFASRFNVFDDSFFYQDHRPCVGLREVHSSEEGKPSEDEGEPILIFRAS